MRVNVNHNPDDYAAYEDKPQGIAGYYDSAAVKLELQEPGEWDGNNIRGVCSGLQTSREVLILTAGGRWVLHHDARSEFNGGYQVTFISAEQAQQWLMKAEFEDELEEYFPDMPEEAGPGRPAIGKPINVRLGDALDRVDAWATRHDTSRADAVRQLVEIGLTANPA
jgi:hypothetical protein